MYKIVIVGAGNMAKEYVHVINKIKEFRILGVVSRKNESFNKIQSRIRYKIQKFKFKNLKKNKIDLILVAVSEENTLKILKRILDLNSIVLCEKPIGINYSEFLDILETYKKRKKLLFVALNRRYYSSINYLKNSIRTKNINKITITDQQDLILAKKIGKNKNVIKYWMYANSIHLIDLINFFSSNSDYKILQKKVYKKLNKKIIKCTIQTKNIIFNYKSYWNINKRWEIKGFGKKIYKLKPIEKIFEISKDNKIKELKISLKDIEFKPGLFLLMKKVLNFLKFKEKKNLVTLQDHLSTINLIKDIYEET